MTQTMMLDAVVRCATESAAVLAILLVADSVVTGWISSPQQDAASPAGESGDQRPTWSGPAPAVDRVDELAGFGLDEVEDGESPWGAWEDREVEPWLELPTR